MSEWGRRGLTALGVLLLLPGACSLAFSWLGLPMIVLVFDDIKHGGINEYSALEYVWIAGLACGALGVWLLFRTLRR